MFCIPWLPSWITPKPQPEVQTIADDVSNKIQKYVLQHLTDWSVRKDYPVERNFSWEFNWETRQLEILDHWFTYFEKNDFGGKTIWKVNHWSEVGKIDLPESLVQSTKIESEVEREVLRSCEDWGNGEPDIQVDRTGFCFWREEDPLRITVKDDS